MNQAQVENFIYETLQTEISGSQIYEKALACAEHPELRKEWQMYHEQTKRHVRIVQEVCSQLGLEANRETPGRRAVRNLCEALIKNMDIALQSGDRRMAQIAAAEGVLHAESKDHMNWQLIGLIAREAPERMKQVLARAYDQIEDQEDEHYFHTRGWVRELWAECLGIRAVLPPPEEKMDVKTALGAASAERARGLM